MQLIVERYLTPVLIGRTVDDIHRLMRDMTERDKDLASLLDRQTTADERQTLAEALDLLARVAMHA